MHSSVVRAISRSPFPACILAFAKQGELTICVNPVVEVFEAAHLVARKSCSDATMTFWKEANISRLNLNQSNWTDSLPIITNDMQLVDSKGRSKSSSDSECFDSFGERVQLL